jgi:hypothetical protein
MRAAPIVLAVAVGTVSGGPEDIARQSSETGTLVVVVRERGSWRPISGAEVEVKPIGNPLPITIWTDANGAARIPDLPAGPYALYVKSAEHLSSLFRARGFFIKIPPVSPIPSVARSSRCPGPSFRVDRSTGGSWFLTESVSTVTRVDSCNDRMSPRG